MIGDKIDIAAAYLRAGNVVAIPTETVYGLACNALDTSAITKVFEVKQRPYFDPLIVHVDSIEKIEQYAFLEPEILNRIAQNEMPGPLTLLLKKKDIIPDLITAGSPQVAIRIPSHPFTRKLLRELDLPIAAPSANPFGYISPTSAKHVEDQLGDKIPYILDGGNCQIGLESTIIGMQDGLLTVFRKGGLSLENIQEYEQDIKVIESSSSNPQSPGMLKSHYAPSTSFVVVDDLNKSLSDARNKKLKVGVLAFGPDQPQSEVTLNLSPSGKITEAAVNLFSYMRILDGKNLDLILTSFLPEENLGLAINDRLRRAAVQEH